MVILLSIINDFGSGRLTSDHNALFFQVYVCNKLACFKFLRANNSTINKQGFVIASIYIFFHCDNER